jgi:hypothetical protein
MNPRDLQELHTAVESLLQQASFTRTVEGLKMELSASPEPFVWSTVPLDSIGFEVPAVIKSCWIFLLKKDVPSGCHTHPNSVQHMAVINGTGRSEVGGVSRPMVPIGSDRYSLEEKWHIIGHSVPHEFFPEGEDMAVVSFHTCDAAELQEISCETGASRHYKP